MQWPWKWRRRHPEPDHRPDRAADALRHLHRNYQKQERMWALVILSALAVGCLFFVFSVFTPVSLYLLTIPLVVTVFAGFQLRRCRELVRILRHALSIQQAIDKADAKRERERAEAELEERRQRVLREAERLKREGAAQRATDEPAKDQTVPEAPGGGQGGGNLSNENAISG